MSGIIRLGGDLGAPWLNNQKAYFVAQEDIVEGKKPRKKQITEYKPGDIEAYSTYTEDEAGERSLNELYLCRSYGTRPIKSKKGKSFVRKVLDGKIKAYSYNPAPSKKIVATAEERAQDRKSAFRKSTIYISEGTENLQKIVDVELSEALKDCPEVVEKIKSEAYGFKAKKDRKKKKGFGKLMNAAMGDNSAEHSMLNAIRDYNACN